MARRTTTCLAFDFGAGSGRALLAQTDGTTLQTRELLRFPSVERADADGLHWDAAALFAQVECGLQVASGHSVASVGVDTWGLDYGLVGADGALLADPHHYRDGRALRGYARSPFADDRLARLTGAQVLPVNTLFQLIEEQAAHPGRLHDARHLLMMADLVNHHLTGLARSDATLARTTGLHAWAERDWSAQILAQAGIPAHLFAPLVPPGTVLGPLRPELAARVGLTGAVVTAVAGHDTASAICALPLQPGEAFLVAGTWNLLGFETKDPPPSALHEGFGIEGGTEGRALVTRSLDGMLLMRRLQADLARGGRTPGFAELQAKARRALAQGATAALDTSDPALRDTGFIAAARRQLGTGTEEELVLALYLGLARKVAEGMDRIARIRGTPATALRVGGGGARDALLCELLATLTGCPVIAGPVEASATGNALVQFIALGAVGDLAAARRLVAQSGLLTEYAPRPDLEARLKGHHART